MAEANILIVEDDDIVARTVERSLLSANYKITKANSGEEGLRATQAKFSPQHACWMKSGITPLVPGARIWYGFISKT
jgi:ActR/RegA family two-component response regulator